MILQNNEILINKEVFEKTPTFDKVSEVYRITNELIDSLSEEALEEMLGGYENDLEVLLRNIATETYSSIYGQELDKASSKLGQFNTASVYYLEKLSESIEETLRVENINYFILSVMPDFEMNWHHVEWGDIVMNYTYYNLLAARDHGKSYFFSNAVPCWRLYRYNKLSRRRDLNINGKEGFIFSFSNTQAKRLLETVKESIENIPILYDRLYPGKTKGWAETGIKCKNGSKIAVRGMGSSTRGAHPGWIMVDDGLKDNVIYSSDQRKKNIDYFHSVIMNMIMPKGPVGVVGTPFHQSDLYGDLKTKRGWHVREYPSIFPDGRILWKNRYGVDDLMLKRDTQGSLNFSREHLCRPITSDSTIFPIEILIRSIRGMENFRMVKNIESYPTKLFRVAIGCDFAISSSVGADYSVFIVGGLDEENTLHILNVVRLHGKTYYEQISYLKSMYLNFKPDVIYAESNQFQMVMAQAMDLEGLPVFPDNTGKNKYDFKMGLPNLSVKFERGKIKIPVGDQYSKDMKDLIFTELSSVAWTEKGLEGVGNHDDIAMALWQLDKAVQHGGGGFGFQFL